MSASDTGRKKESWEEGVGLNLKFPLTQKQLVRITFGKSTLQILFVLLVYNLFVTELDWGFLTAITGHYIKSIFFPDDFFLIIVILMQ